jgi:hypothetical protein
MLSIDVNFNFKMHENKIIVQIHTIRRASVTEALESCDDGGFWARFDANKQ